MVHINIRDVSPAMFLVGIIVLVLLFFLQSWILMLLWNYAVRKAFNASEINLWTAMGLSIFVAILFKPLCM